MKFIATGLLLLVLTATAQAAEATAESVVERGQVVAQAAFKELSGNLQQAIARGGLTNAIDFCADRAIPLTLGVAQTNGVLMRRVSHRPRNPTNRASAREEALIQSYQDSINAGGIPKPVVEQSVTGTTVFHAPIVLTNPLCLNCHGDTAKDIPADVLEAIKQAYPADRATGFKLNDVRGLWRIEFPGKQSDPVD